MSSYSRTPVSNNTPSMLSLFIMGTIALLIIVGMIFGATMGCASYNRYQRRADAKNQVAVTHILIQKAQQQADINTAQIAATKAEAQKEFQQAVGVRRAEDEIQSKLTPLYIQYLAVKAQLAMANSQNHTVIYVPAGTNGTPVITSNGKP